MKQLLAAILLVLFSTSAFGAVGNIYSGPANNQMQFGNTLVTDFRGLKVLVGTAAGATPRYATLRDADGGAAGYTPSGSKTFVCLAGQWAHNTSASFSHIDTTTTDVGYNSASSGANQQLVQTESLSANSVTEFSLACKITNGKYLQAACLGGTCDDNITVIGIEY